MFTPFARTLRALEADSPARALTTLAVAAALLAAWAGWFLLGHVTVYETVDGARLEAGRAAHLVQAPVAGRVVSSQLALGRAVRAGETLVELEPEGQRLDLEQERARVTGRERELAGLRAQIAVEMQGLADERQAAQAALAAARGQVREAEPLARFAEEETARLERLKAVGMITELEFLRKRSEAQRNRLAAESAALAAARIEADARTRERDRQARIERLKYEVAVLEGQQKTGQAAMGRLKFEVERRRIAAPVAGVLGEVATLRPGAFVPEGERLASVVPPGGLHAVADFPAQRALGRIRPGQPARLRLHGFPWAQYGSLQATVESVATEARAGRMRVEFALAPAGFAAPLQHGLTASVEVAVEQAAPATLVLRAAGGMMASPVAQPRE